MELANKKIAFLGDSITEGHGASSKSKCYVEVFSRLTGSTVLNYGIGGTRIAPQKNPSQNTAFDNDFIKRVDEIDACVDAIVVLGGTNDFGHGDADFGDLSDTSKTTFCGACDTLMRKLIERFPDIPIIFVTPLHRLTEEGMINEISLTRRPLIDYVDAIRKKAEKYSVPVLDLFAVSGMQPNIQKQNELYFIDGLHPNDRGYEKIAKMLACFMKYSIA